ncbi:MAG: flagellar biosynthetic protein FliO [Armatimonadota bacterium]
MNVAALHHRTSLRLALVLLIALTGCIAWAAPAAVNATSTATNQVMVDRDANGNVVGKYTNPEVNMPLYGDTAGGTGSQVPKVTPVSVLNNILSLALVLVLLYLGMLAWKKYGGKRLNLPSLPGLTGASRQERSIHVLESASLGQGRGVHLITVGGRCLLVGATLQSINLLSDVTDDVEMQKLLDTEPETAAASFQQQLARLYSQVGKEQR